MEADRDAVPAGLAFQLQPLRLWHVTKDLHQFVDQLRKQMNHRHMFSHWEINYDKFVSRVLYQLPAIMFRKPRYNRMCRIVISLAGECARSHLKLASRSSKRNVESFDGSPLLKSKVTLSRLP